MGSVAGFSKVYRIGFTTQDGVAPEKARGEREPTARSPAIGLARFLKGHQLSETRRKPGTHRGTGAGKPHKFPVEKGMDSPTRRRRVCLEESLYFSRVVRRNAVRHCTSCTRDRRGWRKGGNWTAKRTKNAEPRNRASTSRCKVTRNGGSPLRLSAMEKCSAGSRGS